MIRILALVATLALALPAAAQELTVVGLDGKAKVLKAADFVGFPRAEVAVPQDQGSKTYEGPILAYVLRAGGLPVGPRLHGDPLRAFVIVTGADGFQAVFSLAELDKDYHDGTVVLGDKVDGQALPAKEGPWRLAVSGDKKRWRSVYGVTRIEARLADAPAAKAPSAMDHAH
ncbi:MAG: molybdopterin-dependent oxidoreductase [Phenylobacterium sp.]|uniref:molybdopterin-dependent oxidoreductase n=1 Tax=Phenylobacterium sp. TaxID=1871053 RepID=UPI002733D5E8|nr:molybdopterin-dependent oxidoreductase [Phenylobacterium sp.]MDP3748902.1 molybdopterin-dependent oxidoreductase [Phenylobacterium sp.]